MKTTKQEIYEFIGKMTVGVLIAGSILYLLFVTAIDGSKL